MSEDPVAGSAAPHDKDPADGRELLVDIRCGFAELARVEADAAAARVAEARRLYDEHFAALTEVRAELDPGQARAAKERAHASFRASVAGARSRGQVEAAAVAWLDEINRVNGLSSTALARVEHEHAVADQLQKQLTRLSETSEAAAAMAVAAAEACREAQAAMSEPTPVPAAPPVDGAAPDGARTPDVGALAARSASRKTPTRKAGNAHVPRSPQSAVPHAAVTAVSPLSGAPVSPAAGRPGSRDLDDDPLATGWLLIDLDGPRTQVIIKLVRRDSRAMAAFVDYLSGGDQAARYHWQVQLSNFIDSVVAAAIDEAWFKFAPGNPFWDQFQAEDSREIARGLAALGFRYDGLGGFVDGRVPSNRDLAMAAGQAGLVPVKIHNWPSPGDAARLFGDVRVEADRYLAARAPALTLGELVRLLGRRAEPLADLWNNWPRCRPLLFSTAF